MECCSFYLASIASHFGHSTFPFIYLVVTLTLVRVAFTFTNLHIFGFFFVLNKKMSKSIRLTIQIIMAECLRFLNFEIHRPFMTEAWFLVSTNSKGISQAVEFPAWGCRFFLCRPQKVKRLMCFPCIRLLFPRLHRSLLFLTSPNSPSFAS